MSSRTDQVTRTHLTPSQAGCKAGRSRMRRHLRQYLRPQGDPIVFGPKQLEQTITACRANGRLPIPREMRTGTNPERFKNAYRGIISVGIDMLRFMIETSEDQKGFAFTEQAFDEVCRVMGTPPGKATVPVALERAVGE